MSTNPTWEKFQRATVTLARSGGIKERLDRCLPQSSFDRARRRAAAWRCAMNSARSASALTRERPVLRGEDAFRATVRKMSCEEAEDLACTVVQMFSAMPRGVAPSCAHQDVGADRAAVTAPRPEPPSVELELDGVPALRVLVARLAADRIHQRPLIPVHDLGRHARPAPWAPPSWPPKGFSRITGLLFACA